MRRGLWGHLRPPGRGKWAGEGFGWGRVLLWGCGSREGACPEPPPPLPVRPAECWQVVGAERAGGAKRRQCLPCPRPYPLLPDPFPHPPRPPLRLSWPCFPLPRPAGSPGGSWPPPCPCLTETPPSVPAEPPPSVCVSPPQVLAGVYPISQLQEPYSAVGYLASRIPLPPLLQLRPPSAAAGWTAWDICEGMLFSGQIHSKRTFFLL